MTTAQHAFCHHCNGYRAIVFKPVEEIEMAGASVAWSFKGYSMECRICSNEVTKVGEFHRVEAA